MSSRPQPIALLGIPVSKENMDQTVLSILNLIEAYRKDLRPRYVATLNVDFLANINSWFSAESSFPELQHALRQAHLVTIDGMPLIWLSRWLGSPAYERVTGVDLLPQLALELQKHKLSIFLLGGHEKTLKLATLYLQALYPDLKIVGAAHPHIDIAGEGLENAMERDSLLLEQINQASPDVLLINLGNPKQELWFERVRSMLRVPVSIGVGGTFDMVTGMVSRAPPWMQNTGLEWIFRLLQEPERLFKRYFVDALKFPCMAFPVTFYHNWNLSTYRLRRLFYDRSLIMRNPQLFISAHHTIAVYPLPRRITEAASQEIHNNSDDLFNQDLIVLDFRTVEHIDLEGIALLIQLWKRAAKDKKTLFALGISPAIRRLLTLHRALDCMKPYLCSSAQDVLARLVAEGSSAGIYDSVQQMHNRVIISFFGRLDNHLNYEDYIKQIEPILFQKECILDLSYCSYIDNTGIAFLLKLRKTQPHHFISLQLTGLQKYVRKALRRAKVLPLFKEIKNIDYLYKP